MQLLVTDVTSNTMNALQIKLEYFNIGTGLCLFVAGILYLLQQDYTSALSWGIFGAMYLVMDSYKPCPSAERNSSHLMREFFGVVGFILAIFLLVYIFFTLYF
jgi:small neutral amino acid transporter SnatA (MarC family)